MTTAGVISGPRRRSATACKTEPKTSFVLDNDPNVIPDVLTQLRETSAPLGLFDRDDVERVELALHEALVNGMYHGNLELDSDLRQGGESLYHQLASRRRGESPYSERRLHLSARFTPSEAVYVVHDEGPGFDPSALPDPFAPTDLERVGGRGLLLIRALMDGVEFNEAGNRVTLTKRRTPRAGTA